jgi:hypothetical protein
MAEMVGYRLYVVPPTPLVGDAHVHHIHAHRTRDTHVGVFSPNTQAILPVAAMAGAIGVFGGVLWGFKGVLLGSALGAGLGVVAVHLGETEKKT